MKEASKSVLSFGTTAHTWAAVPGIPATVLVPDDGTDGVEVLAAVRNPPVVNDRSEGMFP